jgi:hypothetical protein
VVNAAGRVLNSNATRATHVPAGGHFRPAPMPYYMEFSPGIGMHADTCQDIPLPTAAFGCPETLLPDFLSTSRLALR